MTPEDVFEKHTAFQGAFGTWCSSCDEGWPCDAYSVATWAAEQRALSAELVADLVAQRDAAL